MNSTDICLLLWGTCTWAHMCSLQIAAHLQCRCGDHRLSLKNKGLPLAWPSFTISFLAPTCMSIKFVQCLYAHVYWVRASLCVQVYSMGAGLWHMCMSASGKSCEFTIMFVTFGTNHSPYLCGTCSALRNFLCLAYHYYDSHCLSAN